MALRWGCESSGWWAGGNWRESSKRQTVLLNNNVRLCFAPCCCFPLSVCAFYPHQFSLLVCPLLSKECHHFTASTNTCMFNNTICCRNTHESIMCTIRNTQARSSYTEALRMLTQWSKARANNCIWSIEKLCLSPLTNVWVICLCVCINPCFHGVASILHANSKMPSRFACDASQNCEAQNLTTLGLVRTGREGVWALLESLSEDAAVCWAGSSCCRKERKRERGSEKQVSKAIGVHHRQISVQSSVQKQ